MPKAKDELMEQIHAAMAEELLRRIKEGTATAADLNVARQFLKDNGVDAKVATGSPLGNLIESLPFGDETYPN